MDDKPLEEIRVLASHGKMTISWVSEGEIRLRGPLGIRPDPLVIAGHSHPFIQEAIGLLKRKPITDGECAPVAPIVTAHLHHRRNKALRGDILREPVSDIPIELWRLALQVSLQRSRLELVPRFLSALGYGLGSLNKQFVDLVKELDHSLNAPDIEDLLDNRIDWRQPFAKYRSLISEAIAQRPNVGRVLFFIAQSKERWRLTAYDCRVEIVY